MKQFAKISITASVAAALSVVAGSVAAHDIDQAGEPVCIEGDYMMADAQNAPFGVQGPGRVVSMNIIDGTPGITVGNPFGAGNAGTDICPGDTNAGDDAYVECPGPWKPTGVLSGGENGHAFITSAGQQALTQFHRDGTPIRTVSYRPLLGNPTGPAGRGSVPRPLGTQLMPNGNLIQAICDANFFNAQNSDRMGEGESGNPANADPTNSSWLYFPPVYATDARQDNSRLLVIDQVTMKVIDEYTRPAPGEPGHDLWGCFAGIMFSDQGMYVSTFHGGAVLEIDWKAGLNDEVAGVGSNDTDDDFEINEQGKKHNNRAVVTNVIDFRLGEPENNSGWRRDSLRAISFDESGNIYATDRERSRECVRGEAPGAVVPDPTGTGEPPCNPSVFRQRVNIASAGFDDENPGSGWNDPALRRTLALDPGVNVIAGIRMNRMSGKACEHVKANKGIFALEYNENGYALEEDLCDVETLMVAASAMNAGEAIENGSCTGGHPANACFKPGGGVVEYLTHPKWTDNGVGWKGLGGTDCSGDPNGDNSACALPVAEFVYTNANDTGTPCEGTDCGPGVPVDPRMLMIIHEAFGQ